MLKRSSKSRPTGREVSVFDLPTLLQDQPASQSVGGWRSCGGARTAASQQAKGLSEMAHKKALKKLLVQEIKI